MISLRKLELPLVVLALIVGAAFLLKMCYLSLLLNSIFGLVFLGCFYLYVNRRHQIRIPIALLVLVFAALQVDALGNYFRMYGRHLGPLQYDEFSHLAVQVLITPIIIWLVRKGLHRAGHNVSHTLSTLFAVTTMFSLAACYEIVELWDELYFGGQRIWSKYDTANDLQWDLLGILIGALISIPVLKMTDQRSFLNFSPASTRLD